MTKTLVHRAYECEVIQQQYACGDIDRDDAHNAFVRAGMLDVQAAEILDTIDRTLTAANDKARGRA